MRTLGFFFGMAFNVAGAAMAAAFAHNPHNSLAVGACVFLLAEGLHITINAATAKS